MSEELHHQFIELRRAERQLGRGLGRLMRSDDPHSQRILARRIAFAERRLRQLERELLA